jgi:hypothetical protein
MSHHKRRVSILGGHDFNTLACSELIAEEVNYRKRQKYGNIRVGTPKGILCCHSRDLMYIHMLVQLIKHVFLKELFSKHNCQSLLHERPMLTKPFRALVCTSFIRMAYLNPNTYLIWFTGGFVSFIFNKLLSMLNTLLW